MDETLERRLLSLEHRLGRIEQLLNVGPEPAAPRQPPQRPPAEAPQRPARPPSWPDEAPPLRLQARRDFVSARDVEELLGGRVLGWIGGIAIVLGVVFFLVMAIHRGWIDEATRVVLAFAGSTALLLLALWLHERRGRTQASLAAAAAAIASLYASLTAATLLYDLVPALPGLTLAGLIGAVATAIAVRWESPVVGGIGIVGALLAPVLVDADTSTASLAFMCVALVAAVGVLLWRRWDWLALLTFLVSVPQLGAWLEANDDRLPAALAVLAGFWLLYLVAALGYDVRVPTERLRVSSAVLAFLDVVLAAGAGWALLHAGGHGDLATAWILGAAAVHVLLGLVVLRGRLSIETGAVLVALGIALSALGFALALSGPALVAGWAAHAVLLAWLARRLDDPRAVPIGIAFLAAAAVHVLIMEAPPSGLFEGVPDLGTAAVAVALVAAASFAFARLVQWDELRRVLDAASAVALLYLGSIAIVDRAGAEGAATQTGQLLLSAYWAATGLVGLVVGLARDRRSLRLGGLSLLGLAIVKVFLYDLAALDAGYRVLSLIALGLLLLSGAYAYQRMRRVEARG